MGQIRAESRPALFRLDKGDDVFIGTGGRGLEIWGDNDNDSIRGTAGSDLIYGDLGNDNIDAGAGNDRVFGEAGDDRINGGDGSDVLNGGDGNDRLDGGKGVDLITTGGGFDVVFADRTVTGYSIGTTPTGSSGTITITSDAVTDADPFRDLVIWVK